MHIPRPTAFQPIWPPAPDVELDAQPEMREARRMYRAQKTSLAALAHQAMRSHPGADSQALAQEIASLLHNISGTGAYFDDTPFGDFASELEQPVRAAVNANLLQPLCTQILDRLAPPDFD